MTPLVINNKNSFYISGGFFNFLSISQYFNEGIAGQYAYWYSIFEWIELVDCYFNLKVVVKKNLTAVDDQTYFTHRI